MCGRLASKLRDGFSVLAVYQAGSRGGLGVMEKGGQILGVESGRKMEGEGVEDLVWRRGGRRTPLQHDVGGKLPDLQ